MEAHVQGSNPSSQVHRKALKALKPGADPVAQGFLRRSEATYSCQQVMSHDPAAWHGLCHPRGHT